MCPVQGTAPNEAKRAILEESATCLIRREFQQLCRKLRGCEVVLYQSGRDAAEPHVTSGYFARAIVEDEFNHPSDPRRCIVFLKQLTYFDEVVPLMHDSGGGPEKKLFNPSGELIGWYAARDLRTLAPEEFAAIVDPTKSGPIDLKEPGVLYEAPAPDNVPLPIFGVRAYQVRDPAFARAIYYAYEGRCAISGLTMLSPNGKECSLEAVHWYPYALEPMNTISSGGLLAPSWHARIDSGAVLIHDDYTRSAPIEDRETLAITDRRLRLPAELQHWPDIALLRRKRALLGFA
jgi:putative restriction endonuclease